VKRITGLALILSVFWMVNSGYFKLLLLSLGIVSVVGVILINRRMESVDGEYESPIILSLRLPLYLSWLTGEVIKSNIDVVKRIWQKEPDISPTVFRVTADQRTDVFRVLYANSITMTPGTVTMGIDGNVFEVHALTHEAADGVREGSMNRQVTQLEGRN
jgi:multicomponent Na+:H+ antiporter subunit E